MIFPRDDEGKTIDLNPKEWKTEPRPGEPIFGPGLPQAVAYILGLVIVFSVLYWFR
jgi:hypothetical protein